MKKTPLFLSLTLSVLMLANAFATNLLQVSDGGFEALPQGGMSIHKSQEAENALTVNVVHEGVFEGNACLEIDLPVAAYASVSFPLQRGFMLGSLRFAYKGEVADGAHVKIGLQSFKMVDGFNQVDFKLFFNESQITKNWNLHSRTIELAEGATHWQVSIGITGPAKVWIDGMEVRSDGMEVRSE